MSPCTFELVITTASVNIASINTTSFVNISPLGLCWSKPYLSLNIVAFYSVRLFRRAGVTKARDSEFFHIEYTPSYVVDYMVKSAIAPLCEKKSLDDILKIKICDPAMGSGHFLIGAIKYLEEKALGCDL